MRSILINTPLKIILALIFIWGLTILLFGRIKNHQFTNWDDPEMVINNTQIKELSAKHVGNMFVPDMGIIEYQPLTTLSYALNYHFYELNPRPYLISNLIFHLLNVLLVFFLIYYVFQNLLNVCTNSQKANSACASFRKPQNQICTKAHDYLKASKHEGIEGNGQALFIAFVTGLLFAIHPMQIEVVAWISAHNYVLMTFFFLSACIFYTHYIIKKKGHYYILALCLFLCALLSKSTAVVFPAVMLCFDYLYKRKPSQKLITEKLPFVIISLIFGLVAMIPKTGTQYVNLAETFNIIDRLFFAFYTLSFYIIKTIAPFALKVLYLYPDKESGFLPVIFYASPLFITALIILTIKNKVEKEKIIFGLLFLLANIILVLHIIPTDRSGIVADRYVYIGSIGIFIITAVFLQYAAKKLKQYAWSVYAAGLVYAVFLIYTTNNRIDIWADSMTLWTSEIEANPQNESAFFNRGLCKATNRDYMGAVNDCDKALSINPHLAKAYVLRANAKRNMGLDNEIIDDYNKAIQLNKNYVEAYINRGNFLMATGDFQEAEIDYTKAIEINPGYTVAYFNRGNLKSREGAYEEAIEDFTMAIAQEPHNIQAIYNRGNALFLSNNFEQAIADYSTALELNPAYIQAYNNRGLANKLMNNLDAAYNDYHQALSIDAAFADAYINLGELHILLGNVAEACFNFAIAESLGAKAAKDSSEKYCK